MRKEKINFKQLAKGKRKGETNVNKICDSKTISKMKANIKYANVLFHLKDNNFSIHPQY